MKRMSWLTGTGMLALCLVFMGCSPSVTVPDVVGQAQEEAFETIIGAGLTVGTVAQEYSATVVPGSVISQTPTPGASVGSGSAVVLTVSQGAQPVIVPDVVGMTQSAADTIITNALLTVGAATQMYSAYVPSGSVIGQTPTPGVLVSPGSAVALVVSQGPLPVTVPDVVGMTQPDADTVITNALLAVGTVTQMYSAMAAGLVIGQSPTPGLIVPQATAVNLDVSIGPVFVPNVVGLTQSVADTVITNALLTVGAITQVYSATVAPGSVSSQSPVSGTPVSPGSAVALAVSVGLPVTVPDVAGMTLTAAQTVLTDAGLTTGVITEGCSDTVPAFSVIGQTPAAGQQVTPGSAVVLGVSTGELCDVAVEMLPVSAGTFTMGNSGVGDDATYGKSDELPLHPVTLNAYQTGKYLVTNQQYCDVLNWAQTQGYLKDKVGADWAGVGADLWVGSGMLQRCILYMVPGCNIQYSGGVFSPKTRTGLPGTTDYSMDTHPVVSVTWFGAVAFCNWLSQMQGLTLCYDMTVADWPLMVAPPASGGYRLPTEAEWERAAAWDGTKHWIYGFTSDTLTGLNQANYSITNQYHVNPLGLVHAYFTSPVGWFDGVNVSPNGSVQTLNSVSPVGAYDMSGNAFEWCGDWHSETYYQGGAMTNPTGPETPGCCRVLRGGSWDANHYSWFCRTAGRYGCDPDTQPTYGFGFRIVRTP